MSKPITFIDSGVLITAARSQNALLRQRAIDLLFDPQRDFATSVFVQLEVMPKALWIGNQMEQQIYETFFRRAQHWPADNDAVIARAQLEAATYGLGAMDALHIGTAQASRVALFVTADRRQADPKAAGRTGDQRLTA